MGDPAAGTRREHWDGVYRGPAADVASWSQPTPATSLVILDGIGIGPPTSLVDVGGGESRLVDALLSRGLTDLSVVDLSAVALDASRRRLGAAGQPVSFVLADVTTWRPARRFEVWHDRAVLHFLVDDADRAAYFGAMDAALGPGGHAVIAAYAPDGPTRSAGLPVVRYSPAQLLELAGPGYAGVRASREEHRTPGGQVHPFTWVVLRRR